MSGRAIFYVSVLILVIVDAWLLRQQNLVSKLGVWIYNYAFLKSFPAALGSVGLSALGAVAISEFASKLRKPMAISILVVFLLLCLFSLGQVLIQFSEGSYKLTGAYFKMGVFLWPSLLAFIFMRGIVVVFKRDAPPT